jgi:predicted dehydrogenase
MSSLKNRWRCGLQDADDMMRACDEAGVKLFVVKQNRFNVPVVKAREALEAGRFGKLILGTVRVRWCRDQAYYDQDEWRGTWVCDGGVLSNQASHHVDMLGKPVSTSPDHALPQAGVDLLSRAGSRGVRDRAR